MRLAQRHWPQRRCRVPILQRLAAKIEYLLGRKKRNFAALGLTQLEKNLEDRLLIITIFRYFVDMHECQRRRKNAAERHCFFVVSAIRRWRRGATPRRTPLKIFPRGGSRQVAPRTRHRDRKGGLPQWGVKYRRACRRPAAPPSAYSDQLSQASAPNYAEKKLS